MSPRTQAEIDIFQDQRSRDIDEIKEIIKHVEEVVITGNGEPSLREQVRSLRNWVNNVNKFGFVFVASIVGIMVSTSCAMFFGVVILLFKNGLFKIP